MARPIPYTLGVAALFFACAASSPSANAEDEGPTVRSSENIENFERLSVSHGFSVQVQQGSPAKVDLEVSPEIRDRVLVEQDGDGISIGLKPNTRTSGNVTLKAVVTVPQLHELHASGAAKVEVAFALTRNVEVRASGASRLDLELDAEQAEIEASGASRLALRGKAKQLELESTGASQVEANRLEVQQAELEASGASEVELRVIILDASLSGASQVSVQGTERIERANLSGGSTLRHPKTATVRERSVSGGSRLVAI